MKAKFDIARKPAATSAAPRDQTIDRFVAGTEPMTTMTFHIPERLKRALKQAALDRDMTVKDVLITMIEAQLAELNQ
jgi:hypothetical protein